MGARGPAGSIWLEGLRGAKFAALKGDASADVAVVGGGIAGLLVAERLAARGADVMVLESGRVGRGVTGNTTGKLSALQQTAYSEIGDPRRGEFYADASLAGLALVEELVNKHSIDCDFERRDAWTFASTESDGLRINEELAAAEAAGLAVSREVDNLLPLENWGSIRLPDQAQFNAAAFTDKLARALKREGSVRIHENTRVTELHEKGHGIGLTTEHGEVRARRVVIATHIPFADRGAFFARMEPQRSYCVAFEIESEVPEGMYISAGSGAKTRSLRSVVHPRDGRRLLIVGGEGHRVGESNSGAPYRRLNDWTDKHFGVVAVTNRWSSQDYMTADRTPMVGALHPLSDKVMVATGFNKWGLANAGAAAIDIDLTFAGQEPRWTPIFNPWRISVGQVAELAKGGFKFTEHFIKDHVVHRNAPTCTHMGCKLLWNDADDSWDCPCHGSRFDAEGHVIQGPATKDIEGLTAS
jgi:glycine/D-amino acid oxidase-like deaminating enzyme